MPLRVTRRNVQGGMMTAHGFVPFRSSSDYDADRAGDDYGARTDNTGFKRRTRVAKVVKKVKRRAVAKGKRKATKATKGRKRNGRSYVTKGERVPSWHEPKAGEVWYLSGVRGVIKRVGQSDGTPYVWFVRPVDGTLAMSVTNLIQAGRLQRPTASNPRRKSASLLRPSRGKASPRVGAALAKYVRSNPKGKQKWVWPYRANRTNLEHVTGNWGLFHDVGFSGDKLYYAGTYNTSDLTFSKKSGLFRKRSEALAYIKQHSGTSPNPGKRKRAARGSQEARWRLMGIRRLKGVHSGARRMEQIRQSRDRGSMDKSPYSKGLKVNPARTPGTKIYTVRVPRTPYDTGYTLTIRAKTKRTARAEAKSYCSESYSQKTGRTKSSYRLPATTKVTEARS